MFWGNKEDNYTTCQKCKNKALKLMYGVACDYCDGKVTISKYKPIYLCVPKRVAQDTMSMTRKELLTAYFDFRSPDQEDEASFDRQLVEETALAKGHEVVTAYVNSGFVQYVVDVTRSKWLAVFTYIDEDHFRNYASKHLLGSKDEIELQIDELLIKDNQLIFLFENGEKK